MIMYYKFVVYPDAHGSAHLMDDKGNELGLCALFPDNPTMLEIEAEVRNTELEVVINHVMRGE